MKTEKDLQDEIMKLIKKEKGHAVNVEPGITNPGTPDINWSIPPGIEGWIECKFVWEGKRCDGYKLIRPHQLSWFRKRIVGGGFPTLIFAIASEDYMPDYLVYRGSEIERLAQIDKVDDLFDIPSLRVVNLEDLFRANLSVVYEWQGESIDGADGNSRIITFN